MTKSNAAPACHGPSSLQPVSDTVLHPLDFVPRTNRGLSLYASYCDPCHGHVKQQARECRPASLGVNELGVDTGTDYVFIIGPGKTSCQVTEQRQDYSAKFSGSQDAVSTVPCRRTAVTRSGVAPDYGGRDVLIAAKVSVQSPPPA